MKTSLKTIILLSLMTMIFLTGCIQTVSPDTNAPVKVLQSQQFSAKATGELLWILDGDEVGTGGTYTYIVDKESFGNHQLVVKEKGIVSDSRTWTIIDIQYEICDGIDNDGNGEIDDNIAPVSSECGIGECHATGERTCVNGKIVDTCLVGEPIPLPSCLPYSYPDSRDQNCNGIPDIEELPLVRECCNGIDDDDNGLVDDGLPSTPTTCGVGACKAAGELKCIDGVMKDTCVPGIASPEVCDGIDNDCNGQIDDMPCHPVMCQLPVCHDTTQCCMNGGWYPPNPCQPEPWEKEVCDGVDNDCDGTVDNGIPSTPTTCGVGACKGTGELKCINGVMKDSCIPGPASIEVCDGIDNDCDGLVDEENGCPPANVQASDLGSGLPDVQITWSAVPGATKYKVYRAIWEADAEYKLVGETTETSFEYHQNWNTDVYAHIGDFPRMAPDATMEEKTAFDVELTDFREWALPYYMNFKCPSFFKVQACDDDTCTPLSEPDAGQAKLIHTAGFSEVAELVIPLWIYPFQKAMATVSPKADSLSWCGLDQCGAGGGMMLGRLHYVEGWPIQVDMWYDNWTEKWTAHPNANFHADGYMGGIQKVVDGAVGIFILQGSLNMQLPGISVDAYIWVYTGGWSGHPNKGEIDITANGQTYTFPLPVHPVGWTPDPTIIIPPIPKFIRPVRPALTQIGTPVWELHMPICDIAAAVANNGIDDDFDGEIDQPGEQYLCPDGVNSAVCVECE